MKHTGRALRSALFLTIFLVFAVGSYADGQNDESELISKQKLIDVWNRMGDYTVALAGKMPAEHYAFTPVEGLRTFAEQMYHIAGSNYALAGMVLKGEQKAAPEAKDKETVIKFLKESFAAVAAGLEKTSLDDLKKTGNNPKWTGFDYTLFFIDHLTHTRGISLMYLRSKGIAPPQFQSYITFGN